MTLDELYRRAGITRPAAGSIYRPLDMSGQNPFSSPTGYGSSLADDQRRNEFAPLVNAVAAVNPVAPVANWTFGGANTGNTGPAQTNITTLRNTKNPEIESATNAILASIKGLSTDPTKNTSVVKANTKSDALGGRVTGQYNQYDLDVNNHNQSIADFTSEFLKAGEDLKKANEQETGAIGNWFTGGVQGELDRLANQRQQAVHGAVNRSLDAARRNYNVGNLLGGNSSYLDQQFLGSAGDILSREAIDNADLRRQNYLTVQQALPQLAGSRQRLVDQLIQRQLLPVQAQQQISANDLNRLAQIGSLENANTFYQLDSPESMLGRKLDLLRGASSLDLANNFYGLSKPYESDVSGFLPVRNQGYTNYAPPIGGGFGFDEPSVQAAPAQARSPAAVNQVQQLAEQLYRTNTGTDPRNDPNFSQELWRWAVQQAQGAQAPRPQVGRGVIDGRWVPGLNPVGNQGWDEPTLDVSGFV